MKFKKTSAALLVATMTVAGSGIAWASESFFNPSEKSTESTTQTTTSDSATITTEDTVTVTTGDATELKFPKIPEGYPAGNLTALQKAFENADNDTAKAAIVRNAERAIAKFEAQQEELKQEEEKTTVTPVDTTELKFPEIPEGYPAGNLAALQKAFENAGNDTAKAAIVRNAERAITKFEAQQEEKTTVIEEKQVEEPTTSTPVVEPVVKQPVVEEKAAKPTVEERKAVQQQQITERKNLQQQQKEERQALKEEHKAEKQALKQEQNAEKQTGKDKE